MPESEPKACADDAGIGATAHAFAAEPLNEVRHVDVIGENFAPQRLGLAATCVFEQRFHETPAHAAALRIGAHQNGVLAVHDIGVKHEPRHADDRAIVFERR